MEEAGCWTRPDLRFLCGAPAGIEPATPSLPWNHQEPLCGSPFPQVTPDRRGRSYRFSFGEVMGSHAWDSWSLRQIILRPGVHEDRPSPRLGGERRLVCRRTGGDDVPDVLHVARGSIQGDRNSEVPMPIAQAGAKRTVPVSPMNRNASTSTMIPAALTTKNAPTAMAAAPSAGR
jgi:hypothetical protein